MVASLRLVIGVSALLLVGSAYAADSKDVNLVAETQQFEQGNKVAVLVGIEDYSRFRHLDYAADDAQQLASVLKSAGYLVKPPLLNTEANKSFILDAIRQAGKTVRDGEGTLVFFFSGHGARRGGENYLATADALPTGLESSGLSEAEVVQAIRDTKVRRAVLLLDACRDDPIPGSKGAMESFATRDYGEGIQILYSTSRDDFSWESPELGHGVFSHFLSEALSGQAAQGGVVTFANLANYVQDNVSKWTFQHLNTTQQPRQSSQGEPYGPFVLARLGNAPTSQPESPVPAPAPAPTPLPPTSKAIEPGMVNIPAGTFTMGCVDGRDNVEGVDKCPDAENPSHEVSISAFQLAVTDVTFEQWDKCEEAKACPHADDRGWGRGNRPVINVSWNDAQTYLQWLSKESGKSYRLPTEAEWEYAARAGTSTAYSWGGSIGKNKANCDGCGSQWDNKQTSPVRSFAANPFGLYDMNGNVYQWVEDCYVNSYKDAPADGIARQGCGANASRVLRGGSWLLKPRWLRSAYRDIYSPDSRSINVGFRAARTL